VGPALYARLERGVQARQSARVRARTCKTRVLEPLDLPHVPQDEPSVGGAPVSYAHAALRCGVRWPADVDACGRERWLSAAEFRCLFGMAYAEFQALREWRRRMLKRELALF